MFTEDLCTCIELRSFGEQHGRAVAVAYKKPKEREF